MGRHEASDAGFTVLEVLLSIVILGLISTSLCGAIFVIMTGTSYTLDRSAGSRGTVQDSLFTSHDQQLADAAFSADVQGSDAVTTGKPSCVTAPAGVVATSLVTLHWKDSQGGAATRDNFAWYYLARPKKADGSADLGRLGEVRRAFCSQTIATPPVVTARTDQAVARALGPTTPALACDGHAPPCVTDPNLGTPTKVVALQMKLGLDSSVTFGVQGQRRMVTP